MGPILFHEHENFLKECVQFCRPILSVCGSCITMPQKSIIQASEQPIAKIFSSEYSFVIPDFQRPYSWGRDQVDELKVNVEVLRRKFFNVAEASLE